MRHFLRQLRPATVAIVIFTVLCGIVYPLVVTALAQATMPGRANGSLITVDGKLVGSRLLGQNFTEPRYFHPRPSAAGAGYDGSASAPFNVGPTSEALIEAVAARVAAYRAENQLDPSVLVPVDAVTGSGSGLDPHISPRNAELQAGRVAAARGMPVEQVKALIAAATQRRTFGVLGENGVNVLELNLALDATTPAAGA